MELLAKDDQKTSWDFAMCYSHTHGRHHKSIIILIPRCILQICFHALHGKPPACHRFCHVTKNVFASLSQIFVKGLVDPLAIIICKLRNM